MLQLAFAEVSIAAPQHLFFPHAIATISPITVQAGDATVCLHVVELLPMALLVGVPPPVVRCQPAASTAHLPAPYAPA